MNRETKGICIENWQVTAVFIVYKRYILWQIMKLRL